MGKTLDSLWSSQNSLIRQFNSLEIWIFKINWSDYCQKLNLDFSNFFLKYSSLIEVEFIFKKKTVIWTNKQSERRNF